MEQLSQQQGSKGKVSPNERVEFELNGELFQADYLTIATGLKKIALERKENDEKEATRLYHVELLASGLDKRYEDLIKKHYALQDQVDALKAEFKDQISLLKKENSGLAKKVYYLLGKNKISIDLDED